MELIKHEAVVPDDIVKFTLGGLILVESESVLKAARSSRLLPEGRCRSSTVSSARPRSTVLRKTAEQVATFRASVRGFFVV